VATGLARAAATPVFFLWLYGWLPLDDAAVVAYVAAFWFTSGYALVHEKWGGGILPV